MPVNGANPGATGPQICGEASRRVVDSCGYVRIARAVDQGEPRLTTNSRRFIAVASAACGLVYVLSWMSPVPAAAAGVAGYVCLAVLPGLPLIALTWRSRPGLESHVAALALGPVLSGILITLIVIAGVPLAAATKAACVAFAALSAVVTAAAGRRGGARGPADRRDAPEGSGYAAIWATAAVAVALLAVFPTLGEAARMRSDAWFHSAVVSEIKAFGLPPDDPYFSGMRLQYMWLYHVYVAALSEATAAAASWAMALVNLQALACLVLAAGAVPRALGGTRRGAALSSIFTLVGMNCLFWAFLPLKLARAAFGQVRGWSEVSRQLSLSPLDSESARTFVSIWKSQPFFLDKFIVATAFSLGICLSVSFFLFAYRYIASGRRSNAALASFAMAGLILFHTPAAVAACAAAGAALAIVALASRPFRGRAVVLLLCMAAVTVLALPYLYVVSAGKEADQLVPIGVSLRKTAAVLISCAGALVLGGPWVARFLRDRRAPQFFYGVLAAAALAVALLIVLPGPNVYDKPPYFAFLPLAPLAGWSISAIYRKGKSAAARAVIAALLILAIAPDTVLLYTAYLASDAEATEWKGDAKMYAWIAANTPRDSVFLEDQDRVGMVVLGPRRLIWGNDSYAFQWGYDRAEMDRRRSLRDRVFSGRPLTRRDADELAGFGDHVYIVVRGGNTGVQPDVLARSPYLSLEYSDSNAEVYRLVPPTAR
jgi:hypothetical protein